MNQRTRRSYRLTETLGVVLVMTALGSCSGGGPAGPSGVPASIALVSGDGQAGQVGTALAQDFVARVDGTGGTPVSGVTVTWAVASGGGTITPTTDQTDANGLTNARLTLGPSAGANTATAIVAGNVRGRARVRVRAGAHRADRHRDLLRGPADGFS